MGEIDITKLPSQAIKQRLKIAGIFSIAVFGIAGAAVVAAPCAQTYVLAGLALLHANSALNKGKRHIIAAQIQEAQTESLDALMGRRDGPPIS